MNRNNRKSNPEQSLEETVKKILQDKKTRAVSELFTLIQNRNSGVSREEFAEALRTLKEEDKVTLEMPPPSVRSLREYLLGEWNAWFNFVFLLCMATLVAIYLIPPQYPYVVFRWIVGSVFVLFVPGYVTVQALFPSGRDLDDIERLALSIGLSLAITPLIGLLLNYTPWGIRLDPIVSSLCLYSLAIGLTGVWRRYRKALTNTGPATTTRQHARALSISQQDSSKSRAQTE